MTERYGVGLLHPFVAVEGVLVEVGGEMDVQDRHQTAKSRAPDQPLEVRSARMIVGTVQAGAGDELDETLEERLVTRVHPDGDRGLFAVAAEAPFADEDPDQEPQFESLRCDSPPLTCAGCYTVW